MISRSAEHTRALQRHWRSVTVAKLVVRVFVVRRLPEDADHVSVTNLNGPEIITRARVFEGEHWKAFEPISPLPEAEDRASKLWCLVVEDIISIPG